jgi:hypothetical protein
MANALFYICEEGEMKWKQPSRHGARKANFNQFLGDFLIAIMYISSLELGRSFHELTLECRFEDTEVQIILLNYRYNY